MMYGEGSKNGGNALHVKLNSHELDAKAYLRLYKEWGYEFGVGAAGRYAGHAHRFFWDIMYCPAGIECVDVHDTVSRGALLVVPPETYYRADFNGPFAFLKFASTSEPFIIPDKVPDKLSTGTVRIYDADARIALPWVRQPYRPSEDLSLELDAGTAGRLTIRTGTDSIVASP